MSNTLATIMLINDALTTINALQPLVMQAMREGREVTDEELSNTADALGLSIDDLDKAIARAKAGG